MFLTLTSVCDKDGSEDVAEASVVAGPDGVPTKGAPTEDMISSLVPEATVDVPFTITTVSVVSNNEVVPSPVEALIEGTVMVVPRSVLDPEELSAKDDSIEVDDDPGFGGPPNTDEPAKSEQVSVLEDLLDKDATGTATVVNVETSLSHKCVSVPLPAIKVDTPLVPVSVEFLGILV